MRAVIQRGAIWHRPPRTYANFGRVRLVPGSASPKHQPMIESVPSLRRPFENDVYQAGLTLRGN